MFFHSLELTNALRPCLEADESLLFVQDAVGLYEGKYKLPRYQNGHVYLTSHRICYVDDNAPKELSIAIDLSDAERCELQAGFLTSSPKITIFAKPPKIKAPSASPNGHSSRLDVPPAPPVPTTWICSICSFPNPVPPNFDPNSDSNAAQTPAPPCQACGIKPPIATVLKAAIAGATHRSSQPVHPSNFTASAAHKLGASSTGIACPRCTFANHASLPACEICGSPLPLSPLNHNQPTTHAISFDHSGSTTNGSRVNTPVTAECIKLSFRSGGDKMFCNRLKDALIQRKWLLRNAPKPPESSSSSSSCSAIPTIQATSRDQANSAVSQSSSRPVVGIAGLERRGLETRDKNTRVIGGAFEDLEALMASAKQIVALAETFGSSSKPLSSSLTSNSTTSGTGTGAGTEDDESKEAFAVLSRIGTFTTRDMFGAGGSAEELYLKELARHLAEYLTASSPAAIGGESILAREGGIMSLVDAWALFNAARNGVELVSPTDFRRAAELWSKIALPVPVRLRRFKSGVFAVQKAEWNDEAIMKILGEWLMCCGDTYTKTGEEETRPGVRSRSDDIDTLLPESKFGCGVTAQETADRFGWSVGIAAEELEMAEEKGFLCREDGIEGLRFWRNWLVID